MKYWWILVLLALALVVWGIRERFEATPSIKAPPYDAAEKVRIFDMVRQRSSKPPYTFLGYQDLLMSKAKAQAPTETNETKLKEIGGGLISPAIESFFTSVYKPATTPIKQEDIDKFMETRTSDLKDVEKDVLTTYFIGQSGAGSSAYSAILSDMGQSGFGYAQQGTAGSTTAAGSTSSSGTGTTTGPAECPAGYQDKSSGRGSDLRCVKEFGEPVCPGGSSVEPTLNGLRCNDANSTQPVCTSGTVTGRGDGTYVCAETILVSRSSSGTPPGGSITTTGNNTTGGSTTATATNTTGGSTTATGTNATGGSTTGTNSAGASGSGVTPANVRKNNVLGPVFTSYGAPIDGSPDSHKTNQYPELLGGGDAASRRRQGGGGFGIGIDLKGSMPTMESLGATEQSKFFPFSRQPGDMELIPDPYRVSQQFSSASYSFKTEPTPFLTDFSAFLR